MNMTAAMEARTNKPLTACTDQEIYLALLDIVRELYQRRVSDRQAAVQQPYQFRAVRRHPRRAGRCREKPVRY